MTRPTDATKRSLAQRRKLADLYRAAAREVEMHDDYSCNVVARLAKYTEGPRERYEETFDPMQVWDYEADQQDIRVLMLCFMAAMTERP